MDIIINQDIIKEIRQEYADIGYIPSALEVANDYWHRGLNVMERHEVSQPFAHLSIMKRLRASVAEIAKLI